MAKWITTAGKKIEISDMTDSHLSNAIRQIEKRNEDNISEWKHHGFLDQSVISHHDMVCIIHADTEEELLGQLVPSYLDLKAEQRRRGLGGPIRPPAALNLQFAIFDRDAKKIIDAHDPLARCIRIGLDGKIYWDGQDMSQDLYIIQCINNKD